MNPAVRDKLLTQASTALLFIGSTLMFFGWSPLTFTMGLVICALGFSFQITARSLVTSLVDKNLLGTVYTAIATVTSGGMVLAGPLLAYTFKWGMLLGIGWDCLFSLRLVSTRLVFSQFPLQRLLARVTDVSPPSALLQYNV